MTEFIIIITPQKVKTGRQRARALRVREAGSAHDGPWRHR